MKRLTEDIRDKEPKDKDIWTQGVNIIKSITEDVKEKEPKDRDHQVEDTNWIFLQQNLDN